MNTLISIINSVDNKLNAGQIETLAKRIVDAQSADRGQGRVKKTTERASLAKVSLPKKGTLEQSASWSQSRTESWEAPVTPSLRLEAFIKAWEDGVKRGLFDVSALPPVSALIRQWIEKLITNL